eukprot:TRINITY_DN32917_c0_g1_i2.p1 TRINITY_DN32917_c0_g1~~TRINITY_DN32917_c0_g1_i2.p1  ORF type:complete len:708 (-),score=137.33 TRINITY_DN32917_c0_g1_i2:175-2298(-)
MALPSLLLPGVTGDGIGPLRSLLHEGEDDSYASLALESEHGSSDEEFMRQRDCLPLQEQVCEMQRDLAGIERKIGKFRSLLEQSTAPARSRIPWISRAHARQRCVRSRYANAVLSLHAVAACPTARGKQATVAFGFAEAAAAAAAWSHSEAEQLRREKTSLATIPAVSRTPRGLLSQRLPPEIGISEEASSALLILRSRQEEKKEAALLQQREKTAARAAEEKAAAVIPRRPSISSAGSVSSRRSLAKRKPRSVDGSGEASFAARAAALERSVSVSSAGSRGSSRSGARRRSSHAVGKAEAPDVATVAAVCGFCERPATVILDSGLLSTECAAQEDVMVPPSDVHETAAAKTADVDGASVSSGASGSLDRQVRATSSRGAGQLGQHDSAGDGAVSSEPSEPDRDERACAESASEDLQAAAESAPEAARRRASAASARALASKASDRSASSSSRSSASSGNTPRLRSRAATSDGKREAEAVVAMAPMALGVGAHTRASAASARSSSSSSSSRRSARSARSGAHRAEAIADATNDELQRKKEVAGRVAARDRVPSSGLSSSSSSSSQLGGTPGQPVPSTNAALEELRRKSSLTSLRSSRSSASSLLMPWFCHVCTSENPPSAQICQACDAPRALPSGPGSRRSSEELPRTSVPEIIVTDSTVQPRGPDGTGGRPAGRSLSRVSDSSCTDDSFGESSVGSSSGFSSTSSA